MVTLQGEKEEMEWKKAMMSQWSCESLLWNEENGLLYICWKVTSRLAKFSSPWRNELSLPVGFCHVLRIRWNRLISPGRNISRHGKLLLSCFSNSLELLVIASPGEIVRHGHLCGEGTWNSLELLAIGSPGEMTFAQILVFHSFLVTCVQFMHKWVE